MLNFFNKTRIFLTENKIKRKSSKSKPTPKKTSKRKEIRKDTESGNESDNEDVVSHESDPDEDNESK